jgi:putative copper export protein/methionine-rich copper-binding protein CopC
MYNFKRCDISVWQYFGHVGIEEKRRMRRRRYPRLLFLSVVGLCTFLLYSWFTGLEVPVAKAHAFVIGSDPVDGSTVSAVPKVVRIFFDTSISSASIAHVYTPDGSIVDARRSSIPSTNPQELDTPLMTPAQLPQGSYTVRWTALANGDAHTTQGVIGFDVGYSSAGLSGQPILGPSTSNIPTQLSLLGVLLVAWEWLVMVALTFWVGILVTEGLVLGREERAAVLLSRVKKQTLPLQWLALSALLVGELIILVLRATLLVQGLGGSGIDWQAVATVLLQTNYGHLWLVRVVLVVVALAFLWWSIRSQGSKLPLLQTRRAGKERRFRQLRQRVTQEIVTPKEDATEETSPTPTYTPPRWYIIAWSVLAGLILLTLALSGDAAQVARPQISAVVLDWLYLVAQCIWFGSIAYLGYLLLPLLPTVEPEYHGELLTTLLRRLGPLIMGALGVLLVSGLYLSEVSVSNAGQLISDPYGRALLVKLVLITIMLILSGYVLFVLRPRLIQQAILLPVVNAELPARRTRQSALEKTERSLKRILVIQSWSGAAVLLCASLMAFFAPPIVFPAINYASSTNPPALSPGQNAQTKKVGDLSVTLQVLPARVDYANTVIVIVKDSRGNPVTDAQVEMTINMELMDMGTAQATVKGGNPVYIVTFDKGTAFSMFGVWDVLVRVSRPDQKPVGVTFQVTLTG